MTITITFPDDFAPYRERVAALTQAIFDLRPGVLDDVKALEAELDERFVQPLRAEYNRVPIEQRAGNGGIDMDNEDAISRVVDAFAGVWELGLMRDIASDLADPNPQATGRNREVEQAALRYRETFVITHALAER